MKFIEICSDIYNPEDIQAIFKYTDNITLKFKIAVKIRGIEEAFTYSSDDKEERDKILAKIKESLEIN